MALAVREIAEGEKAEDEKGTQRLRLSNLYL